LSYSIGRAQTGNALDLFSRANTFKDEIERIEEKIEGKTKENIKLLTRPDFHV